MKLFNVHICKIQVLLAGLLVFVHAVIPHHHHFDSPDSHIIHLECSGTITGKQDKNPDLHCHAFNIAIVERSVSIASKLSQQFRQHFDLFGNTTNEYSVFDLCTSVLIYHLNISNTKSLYLCNNFWRGPPAIV